MKRSAPSARRAPWIVLALLAASLAVPAAYAGGTRAAQKKREVEADAQKIEKLLTAPCCYKGTLTDHASGLAQKMRADIRTMLAEGKNRDQILAHYKKKYGQAVLVEPPGGGLSGFILYGVPFGLAFIGLIVMTVLLTRKRNLVEGPERPVPRGFALTAETDRRLDDLITSDGLPAERKEATES